MSREERLAASRNWGVIPAAADLTARRRDPRVGGMPAELKPVLERQMESTLA